MDHDRFNGTAGLLCLIGGGIVAVGATIGALAPSKVPITTVSYPFTPDLFRVTQTIWAACHLLTFLGTLGFARSGAAGSSLLGRIGCWIALVGMALVAPLELGFIPFAAAANDSGPGMILSAAIGIATTIAGLGFVLAGIAVLLARRWQGWHRSVPLLCGLIVFVVLTPVLASRPEFFLWPLAVWNLSLAFLGLALYRARQAPSFRSVAPTAA